MTIESTNATATTSYRVNPYAPTEIDKRSNRRGSRWLFYKRCASEDEARQEVIRLSQETEGDK